MMAEPKWTVGSNQHEKTPAMSSTPGPTPPEISLVATNSYMTLGPEILESRKLLLKVIGLLKKQSKALTVLGAHAVFEQTKTIVDLPSMDSTNDADLGVTPEFLLDLPLLSDIMDSAGLEPASNSRPGVWGLKSERDLDLRQRLTIDLIAPASVAGSGRRSAEVGPHGKRSVSKTTGTELSLIDRQWMEIDSLDSTPNGEGYVAGVAALVCAKVYKIFDRIDPTELTRNPERFKPKDVSDLFRLMVAMDGAEVRGVFERGIANPDIAVAVVEGKRRLLALRDLGDGDWIADQVIRQWGDEVLERPQIQSVVYEWFTDFSS
ncbi:hypothetical protein FB472_2314 [Rhodoglobus vestalii]|uniref:Uncharacterized protein n=2 Tax=Rhodoglobus vestalii TaxID=193384 RepID=A0A8H2K856_9MICO|nr:hypothetical protein FB472_2314 [Rhodoglobus vestalii]